MTQTNYFPQLAVLSLKDPKAAAQIVLSWQLSREALWTGIALVSVLGTIVSTLSSMMFPVPDPLSALVANPLANFLISVGIFVCTAQAVFWTGKMLGGEGTVEELMVLMLWMQALQTAARAAVLVGMLFAPAVASFLTLFIAVAAFWILINFISVGLRLDSLMRAFFILIVASIALMIGLTTFLSLIGVSSVGVL